MVSTPRLTLRERRTLRAHVLEELIRLEETIAELVAALADLDDGLAGPAGSEGENDPKLIAMRDQVSALLRQTEAERIEMRATQDRIERDDFGFCEVCHEFIGVDRLLVVPTATRCVRCAT